jgi:tripartite-type tricarboxylate transporter receptor subunit TctC
MKRSNLLLLTALILVSMLFSRGPEAAEIYPVKSIICICATGAGDDNDVFARPLLEKASAILGKPIIVVNKPGGGMSIGYRELQSAKPDGYTFGLATSTMVSNKLQGLMPFDYHDYTIMGTYALINPIIVASTKTKRPFKTIQEVISFAKANPGELSMATSAVGAAWWISANYLQEVAKVRFNIITQTTAVMIITQVAGGHTDLGCLATGTARSQVEAGGARPLAVFSPKRLVGMYQHVPTFEEVGYDLTFESPQFILGPPNMPKPIVDKLVRTFREAANQTDYVRFLESQAAFPLYLNPEETVQRLDNRRKIYRDILEKAGILKEKG